MVDIYRLKLSILSGQCFDFPATFCTRVIDIKGSTSLYKLAKAILDAYNFDFDHAFGFYDNIKDPYKSNDIYTLFADMDDGIPAEEDEKSVKKTKISSVFEKGKKMAFLFDYGDDWIFHVNCTSIGEAENGKKYPLLVESKGEAPEQYPEYDEDYEDEYEE